VNVLFSANSDNSKLYFQKYNSQKQGSERGLTRGFLGVGFFASMRCLSSFTSGCKSTCNNIIQFSRTAKYMNLVCMVWRSHHNILKKGIANTLGPTADSRKSQGIQDAPIL